MSLYGKRRRTCVVEIVYLREREKQVRSVWVFLYLSRFRNFIFHLVEMAHQNPFKQSNPPSTTPQQSTMKRNPSGGNDTKSQVVNSVLFQRGIFKSTRKCIGCDNTQTSVKMALPFDRYINTFPHRLYSLFV